MRLQVWIKKVPCPTTEEIYDNMGPSPFVKELKDARRLDVKPQDLLVTIGLDEKDPRKKVLEKIAGYATNSFRVINKNIDYFFIPEDKKFLVGFTIGSTIIDIFIRTPYVDAKIDYYKEKKYPEYDINISSGPPEDAFKDLDMVLGFVR